MTIPFQVVGVSGEGFFRVDTGNKFDVAIPSCADAILGGSPSFRFNVRIMGRRLSQVWNAGQANARLAALSPSIIAASAPAQVRKQNPASAASPTRLEALPSAAGISMVRSIYERPLQILMTIVGLVLLIACANIACLLLSRRRRPEERDCSASCYRGFTVEAYSSASYGVSWFSLAGALFGLFLARWGSIFLIPTHFDANRQCLRQRVSLNLALNWRVLGFTAGAAKVLASILFGTLPSVLSTRVSLISAMKGSRAGEAEHRSRFRPARWLIAMQVALSLVLLFVASLFLQSFRKLATLDTGFDRKNVLLVDVNMHNANVTEAQRSVVCSQILGTAASIARE